VGFGHAGFDEQVSTNLGEAIQVLAARDGRSQSGIFLAGLGALTLALLVASEPEQLDVLAHASLKTPHET
jgi:hypothetical protein